jgi:hypothetical protein
VRPKFLNNGLSLLLSRSMRTFRWAEVWKGRLQNTKQDGWPVDHDIRSHHRM